MCAMIIVKQCVRSSRVFFFQAEDGIRDIGVTGVQTCALPVAASSAPTYVPAILNWGGALIERLPSTYFLWFALPLLPWVRWHGWRRPDRPVTSAVVVAAVFGALTLGPSNLWLFRWPIRLIEYTYLALAVVLALLLSRGLAGDRIRARTLTTVGVVAVGGYLSFAVRPDVAVVHVVAALTVLVLVLLAVAAFHRHGPVLSAAVLVVGTVLVVTYQTGQDRKSTRLNSSHANI